MFRRRGYLIAVLKRLDSTLAGSEDQLVCPDSVCNRLVDSNLSFNLVGFDRIDSRLAIQTCYSGVVVVDAKRSGLWYRESI